MLCCVLFLFALGAKTALYQPDQARVAGFTATKVWENKAVAGVAEFCVVAVAPVLVAAMFLSTLAKLTSYSFVEFAGPGPIPSRLSAWFSSCLAVRPPPAI